MFYIKEFGKLFKANFLVSFMFSVSVLGLMTIVLQKNKIHDELSLDGQTKVIPYFNALVHSDISLGNIKRKMVQLPGVRNILIFKANKIKNEIKHLKKSFNQELIGQLTSINYKKIKIELDDGVKVKSQNLIREYLLRLIGKNSVTLGAVKTPRNLNISSNNSLFTLIKWSETYLIGLFMVMMAISLFLLLKPLNNQSFIIERFQRREYVNTKIMFSGAAILVLLSILSNQLLSSEVHILAVLPLLYIAFIICSFTLGKKLNFKA